MKPPDPVEYARLSRDAAETEAQIRGFERGLAELRAMEDPKVRTPSPADKDVHYPLSIS